MDMDAKGNVVDSESQAFGYPVTVDVHQRNNVFLMDETGDNMHSKDDGRVGGKNFL
jgi:hypothetical protein